MGIVVLPQKEGRILDNFVRRLKDIYKDGLVSVLLYGSAVSGEFAGKHSNINLLIVLRYAGLKELAKSYKILNPVPSGGISCVFFTREELRGSADIFPIEFLDMKENYSVLAGEDVLKDLAVDTRNLRFQCEQELKSKLITVRQAYMRTRDRARLEDLLFRSFTSSLHIMRSALRLKGKEPPYAKDAVITELEKEFGVNTKILSEILWAKNKGMRLSYAEAEALLSGFVGELESVADKVDGL